jgi:hypothetical protein
MTLHGNIGISGERSLAETAELVGHALGVRFSPETTGRYEEYPAYCAEALGLQMALLGVPEAGSDIRDDPDSDYCLQVMSESSAALPMIDLSEYFVELIKHNCDVDCWALSVRIGGPD